MGAPLVVNGWALYAHPQFLAALAERIPVVEVSKRRNPNGYRRNDDAKILAAVRHLIFERIPANPGDKQFRLGGSAARPRPPTKTGFEPSFSSSTDFSSATTAAPKQSSILGSTMPKHCKSAARKPMSTRFSPPSLQQATRPTTLQRC
jgi:hypothetical protein